MPDSFVTACEGDVGSSLEAHCDCIERQVEGNVSPNEIQRQLASIAAGNPPVWYMQAALKCP